MKCLWLPLLGLLSLVACGQYEEALSTKTSGLVDSGYDSLDGGCADQSGSPPTWTIHAGSTPHALPRDQWVVPPPQAESPADFEGLPVSPNDYCRITFEISGPTTVEAGCPPNTASFSEYTGPLYTALILSTTDDVDPRYIKNALWEKRTDVTDGNPPPLRYRWCDDDGKNEVAQRSPQWCNFGDNDYEMKTALCTAGVYTIYASLMYYCNKDCKWYRTEKEHIDVTAQ